MRVNEFEMGKAEAKVDFENMGDFPERLSGLFTALGKGIAKAGLKLLATSFLILPYHEEDSPERWYGGCSGGRVHETAPVSMGLGHVGGPRAQVFAR